MTTASRLQLINPAEVRRTWDTLIPAGQVTELRALNATLNGDRQPGIVSGFFDNPDKLIAALSTIKSASGIYIVPNVVDSALLARCENRIKRADKGATTSDSNIVARRWLLIDCDAVRASGVSATDSERQAALERCERISLELRYNYGWADPIVADSGNGGHLLYHIDLPADDTALVERVLAALSEKFTDAAVKVDTSVHNAARIWKLYGSLAAKGDCTVDRPHRMARMLSVPSTISVVVRAHLEALAEEAHHEQPRHEQNGHHTGNGQPFDIDSFIARNNFELAGPDPYQGGRKWTFNQSPMCDHHGDGPFLIQFASGALYAGCHHESCNWDWRALRAKYEPKQRQGMPDLRPAEYRDAPAPEPIVIEPGQPFPIETLPAVVGAYVAGNASAIGCDPSYVALPLLGCLARAIGNKRVIRLKQSWTEPAIIWGAIVGKSGTHKTPALMASMRFLERRQGESIAAYVEAVAGFEQDKAIYERDHNAWKKLKNTTEPPPWSPVEPVCERFITTDTTIEALAAMLAGQFDGLLVVRDELAGWLGGMNEYKGGRGSDLGHWLACWSSVPLTVDRKTSAVKMLHIPRAAVSILGGIQPGVLRTALGYEHLQDGLCARLLMVMPEPRQVKWTEAGVDPQTEAAMQQVFDRLLTLEPAADGDGKAMPFPIALSPGAKSVWVDYYNRHRAELIELDDDLAAAWSKLEAYTARLALISQLCSWAANQGRCDAIEQNNMEMAIRLSDWFGSEAKRVYGLFGEDTEDRTYRELVEMIQRRGGSITIRELTHGSGKYRARGAAEAALDSLVRAGWGSWHVESTPGRPRRTFKLHPSNPGNSNTSR